MVDPYARLSELGLTLPKPSLPKGSYAPMVESLGMVYISGNLPILEDGALLSPGLCGAGVGVDEAAEAARLCALHIIGRLHDYLTSLAHVDQIVKLVGFVAATASFRDHPQVVNGASDLVVEVFGDRGRHARSAIGVASLPLGSCVEVEAIVRISPEAR
ncbi:MAG: RidA family protein [Acidimicrobiales bacterium]